MAKTTERKTNTAKTAPKSVGKPVPTTSAKVAATLTGKPSGSPVPKAQPNEVVKTPAAPLQKATYNASHATAPCVVKTARPVPTKAAIEKRAYELYLARRATDGHDVQDWIEAERQLRAVS